MCLTPGQIGWLMTRYLFPSNQIFDCIGSSIFLIKPTTLYIILFYLFIFCYCHRHLLSVCSRINNKKVMLGGYSCSHQLHLFATYFREKELADIQT